ncbi:MULTISPECIES: acyltransferase [unclassified Paraburkholderia]|uniref:acyltransferase family protein n=1 Tax=unclassified Paraburkholderia TaxID=2615204 RepID=UPI002AAFA5B8|nr:MULTISPECIES: acyltransferase [unclassified Paraburkholderia]
MKSDRFESIQVLRALAALAVVAFHTVGNVGSYGWSARLLPRFASYGELGVDVFFVISGFVIALVSKGDRGGVGAARQFLVARITRVVPLYWLMTAIFAVLLVVVPSAFGHARLAPWHLITSFIFFPSINWAGIVAPVLNVGWTLNYEAWFYLVFSLALCFTSRPLIFVGIALASTSLLRLSHPTGVAFSFYTNSIVLEFLFGAFVGTYYAAGKKIPATGAGIALLIAIACKFAYSPTLTEENRILVFGIPALTILIVALALEARLRGARLIGKLGDASYSLYLTHVLSVPLALKLIQIIDRQHHVPGDLVAIAVISLAVCVALGCYHLVERPMTRFVRTRHSVRPVGKGAEQAL